MYSSAVSLYLVILFFLVKVQSSGCLDDLMKLFMRFQISEDRDRLTRSGLLNASAGRVGKRMDTLLVPLELLCTVSQLDFPDRKSYLRWEERQVGI